MTQRPRILLVEDEPDILQLLQFALRQAGFDPVAADSAEAAFASIREKQPELVVLDLMLPDLPGTEICKRIKSKTPGLPVVMLTARGDEVDRVVGFELGADDYITKPFSLRELLARVRAVLRRPGPRHKVEEFAFGDTRVRPRGRQAFRAGREVMLTRKEFDLLVYLLEHRGEVVTREQLLEEVWGHERFPTTRTVDTHVLRLRRKFERDPERPTFIVTVHGQGYKFTAS